MDAVMTDEVEAVIDLTSFHMKNQREEFVVVYLDLVFDQ